MAFKLENPVEPVVDIGSQPITSPFTILVDTGEQHPWTFKGMRCDSRQDRRSGLEPHERRPLFVPTQRQYLGVSQGDYQIAGMEGRISIERKSMDDAHSTFLGWEERETRWRNELETLSSMEQSAVVVECSLGDLLEHTPSWGKRSVEVNRKTIARQILSWNQDYEVKWFFCDSRRLAEVVAFRFLERFYRKEMERIAKEKRARKRAKKLQEVQ